MPTRRAASLIRSMRPGKCALDLPDKFFPLDTSAGFS
jgi:hypothetical protein